ncbi:MAG TPA: YfiR family protein [Methylomirabilota bacterium]|nr:YfiR family protein [Methylomirabilota bacterium]
MVLSANRKQPCGLSRRRAVAILLLWALLPGGLAGQTNTASEYEVKAAMLYNLTRFVEWPPGAFPDGRAPTLLCILGRDPFGDSLTSLASRQTPGARPVEIRRLRSEAELHVCQVLYISSSEKKSVDHIFLALRSSSTLTVGEMAQFAARGGMVQFSLEEKQVRFEVNLDAASRADLRISSRLLVLAKVIRNQAGNPPREVSGASPHP